MNIREGLAMGLLEIRTHKMRSFLSFLGVMVGVASVMLTLAFLRGMQERMAKGIALSGPGRIEIETSRQGGDSEPDPDKPPLTLADARAIRAKFPELNMVSPEANQWGRFQMAGQDGDVGVRGITPEFARRDWVYRLRGRLINDHDVASAARVCLLIQKGEPGKRSWWRKYYADYMREDIDKVFQRADPLGRQIQLEDRLFTVVGVLKEPDEDDDPRWFRFGSWERALAPVTAVQRYLQDPRTPERIGSIDVDTGRAESIPFYTRQIRAVLSARHRGKDKHFVFRNRAEMMQESMSESRKMGYVFMAVGIISLFSGGIGIMNVALAVVFSRIREIGIRRAVGATRFDILGQFVLESALLGLLGGIAGVGLGAVGVWQVPKYMRDMEALITPGTVLACLGIAVAVGVFFSIYPAWQAAQLDPVEALRYE